MAFTICYFSQNCWSTENSNHPKSGLPDVPYYTGWIFLNTYIISHCSENSNIHLLIKTARTPSTTPDNLCCEVNRRNFNLLLFNFTIIKVVVKVWHVLFLQYLRFKSMLYFYLNTILWCSVELCCLFIIFLNFQE